MLQALAPDLWTTRRELRFHGLQIGTRMTVIRLHDGGLFLHSPVALDEPTRDALDGIGPVRFVVAPNRLHHLFVGDYLEAFPKARVCAAPGLEAKRADLHFHAVLSDEPEPGWAGEIDQCVFRGAPILNEVVFLHRSSRTLILADLAFNFVPGPSPLTTRILLWMGGACGHFGPTRDMKVYMLARRRGCRESMDRILKWDFDRVVVSHGEVLERAGRENLREAHAFL